MSSSKASHLNGQTTRRFNRNIRHLLTKQSYLHADKHSSLVPDFLEIDSHTSYNTFYYSLNKKERWKWPRLIENVIDYNPFDSGDNPIGIVSIESSTSRLAKRYLDNESSRANIQGSRINIESLKNNLTGSKRLCKHRVHDSSKTGLKQRKIPFKNGNRDRNMGIKRRNELFCPVDVAQEPDKFWESYWCFEFYQNQGRLPIKYFNSDLRTRYQIKNVKIKNKRAKLRRSNEYNSTLDLFEDIELAKLQLDTYRDEKSTLVLEIDLKQIVQLDLNLEKEPIKLVVNEQLSCLSPPASSHTNETKRTTTDRQPSSSARTNLSLIQIQPQLASRSDLCSLPRLPSLVPRLRIKQATTNQSTRRVASTLQGSSHDSPKPISSTRLPPLSASGGASASPRDISLVKYKKLPPIEPPAHQDVVNSNNKVKRFNFNDKKRWRY